MFNSQFIQLKLGVKNDTKVTLNLSSNFIGKTNFPHKLLLTNTQISTIYKTFGNNSSAVIKLSKTQLHKIRQLGRLLGTFPGPLLRSCLSLMKSVLKSLAKSVLIPLTQLAALQKNFLGQVWQH